MLSVYPEALQRARARIETFAAKVPRAELELVDAGFDARGRAYLLVDTATDTLCVTERPDTFGQGCVRAFVFEATGIRTIDRRRLASLGPESRFAGAANLVAARVVTAAKEATDLLEMLQSALEDFTTLATRLDLEAIGDVLAEREARGEVAGVALVPGRIVLCVPPGCARETREMGGYVIEYVEILVAASVAPSPVAVPAMSEAEARVEEMKAYAGRALLDVVSVRPEANGRRPVAARVVERAEGHRVRPAPVSSSAARSRMGYPSDGPIRCIGPETIHLDVIGLNGTDGCRRVYPVADVRSDLLN